MLYLRAAKFTHFESKIGRYTYDPIVQPDIKKFLKSNPIESFIDLEEPENKNLFLFQMIRIGGFSSTHEYTTTYVEMDQTAVPYKYLNQIRVKGCFNDTFQELFKLVKKSGKYFRHIELKEFGDNKSGLQIETCLGNGICFEQEPISFGFGERSNHFRHCRQDTLKTIQQSFYVRYVPYQKLFKNCFSVFHRSS